MISRPCLRCGARIPRGTYCDPCRQYKDAQRVTVEPWRGLYKLKAWHDAQRECLNRDGGQCRALEYGERCRETVHLQAHHTTPLRELWRRADGDLDGFVSAATRVGGLVALCRRHHAAAEHALRRSRSGR